MIARPVHLRTAARWLKRRPEDAHKGDAGRVLIVAGSRDMPGSAALCAMGAARSGAGLVRVATVKSRQSFVARRAPLEATTHAFREDAAGRVAAAASDLRKLISSFQPTVIAFGPGLGRSPALSRLLRFLAFASDVPLVLDADGLNALSEMRPVRRFRAPAVLTPHPGEMSRLLGRKIGSGAVERATAARDASKRFGAVVLLKGRGTVVTDGRAMWRNTTGNAAMAGGGMGDVLTGVIAATWGQMSARTVATGGVAAALGAYIHGLAADIAVKDFPERALTASDLALAFPKAFKRLWRSSARGGRS